MVVHISCLLWNSTRSSCRDAGKRTRDEGGRVDRKGLDDGRERDGDQMETRGNSCEVVFVDKGGVKQHNFTRAAANQLQKYRMVYR